MEVAKNKPPVPLSAREAKLIDKSEEREAWRKTISPLKALARAFEIARRKRDRK